MTLHPFGLHVNPSAWSLEAVIFRRLTYLTQFLAKCEGVFKSFFTFF